ncbi:MAG: S-layer homology domain-containing protein [Clostridia bacterium]|nr:S-layer homology domain-containing protein [Clostridia bacterium]
MSMIKKLIALTLALAMVLSVSAFAGYSADTYADADKIASGCKDAVELMYALDIMTGNDKGEFMPEKSVTRAEMAKIIYVILNYGDDDKAVTYTGGNFFTDVPAGAWYEGYVNYCAATKLIAGRGNGIFDPEAAVTTAEAAKMILTAIGYNAEARGYVGDKWSDNTLADATVIGLLNGYKANVNTAAPRQWIAVMLENALLDAYTYTNMAPTFAGLLTSGEDYKGVVKMGEKYYNLDSFSKVAYATEDAYIDQICICDDKECEHEDEECWTGVAAEGTVLFENGKKIKKTGLKVADLGQKYKVIYNTEDMTAYSVRSLAKVGTARDYECDVDIKHATSGNQPNNKYIFTIGEVKGNLQDGVVKYLTNTGKYDTFTAADLRDWVEAAYKAPNTIKAIDSENDGDIDYLFITEYEYGYVTEVATSEKYGKYINVAKASTEETDPVMFEYAGGDNLYLKDAVITSDEIEEDAIVKMSKDPETGKWVVEVLPQVKGVEYKEYDDEEMIFTLGDKEYFAADTESYDYEEYVLATLTDEENLGEEYNVVYDGDLIVWIGQDDDSYDSMDAVNAQLALVIDAEDEYSNNTIREQKAIEYMTIDGKTHVAKFIEMDGYVDWATVEALAINAENYTVEGRLFKLYTTSKGVYLEELDNDTINTQLKVKKSVLNGYEADDDYCVDATGTSIKVLTNYVPAEGETKATYDEAYKVDAANKYFVGMYDDSAEEYVYTVMTLDELKHCSDEEAYAQLLTYENDRQTRTTVKGGYLFLDLTSDTSDDYLYIKTIGKVTKDGRKCDVVFSDGTTKSVVIDEEHSDKLIKNVLYTYVYNFMADDYELDLIELETQTDEIVDFDDDNIVWVKGYDEGDVAEELAELKKEVIAILTIEVDRDRDILDDDTPAFELVNKGIKFVALKDLKDAMILNGTDNKTYTQYTDYLFEAEDLFYVVDFQIMDTAQEISDDLADADSLEAIIEAILAGEKKIAEDELQ